MRVGEAQPARVQQAAPKNDQPSVRAQEGQTLQDVADQNNTTVDELRKANPHLTDVDELKAGQEVLLPEHSAAEIAERRVADVAVQRQREVQQAAEAERNQVAYEDAAAAPAPQTERPTDERPEYMPPVDETSQRQWEAQRASVAGHHGDASKADLPRSLPQKGLDAIAEEQQRGELAEVASRLEHGVVADDDKKARPAAEAEVQWRTRGREVQRRGPKPDVSSLSDQATADSAAPIASADAEAVARALEQRAVQRSTQMSDSGVAKSQVVERGRLEASSHERVADNDRFRGSVDRSSLGDLATDVDSQPPPAALAASHQAAAAAPAKSAAATTTAATAASTTASTGAVDRQWAVDDRKPTIDPSSLDEAPTDIGLPDATALDASRQTAVVSDNAATGDAAGADGVAASGEGIQGLTEDEANRIGTGWGNQRPPQAVWTEQGVNTLNERSLEQGKLSQQQVDKNSDIARQVFNPDGSIDPNQPAVEVTAADVAALARESGARLDKLDGNQLNAAANYINEGKTLGEQQDRTRKALNNFNTLENGMPQLTMNDIKGSLWDVARVPGHALDNCKGADLQKAYQDVAAAANTPGTHEVKVGKHKVNFTVDEKNDVSGSSAKKEGFWSKVGGVLKKVGKIALTVASFIPGPIGIAARIGSAVISAVQAAKKGSVFGVIAGVAGAIAGGAGAIAGKATAGVASTVARVAGGISKAAQGVQSGIDAYRAKNLSGVLSGVAGVASGVAGAVGSAAGGVANTMNRIADWARGGAAAVNAVDAAKRGDVLGVLASGADAAANVARGTGNAALGDSIAKKTQLLQDANVANQAIRNKDALRLVEGGSGVAAGVSGNADLSDLRDVARAGGNFRDAYRNGDMLAINDAAQGLRDSALSARDNIAARHAAPLTAADATAAQLDETTQRELDDAADAAGEEQLQADQARSQLEELADHPRAQGGFQAIAQNGLKLVDDAQQQLDAAMLAGDPQRIRDATAQLNQARLDAEQRVNTLRNAFAPVSLAGSKIATELDPETLARQQQPTIKPYTVQPNDALEKIAARNGLTVDDLMRANPDIKDRDKIRVGQQIKIPVQSSDPDAARRLAEYRAAHPNGDPPPGDGKGTAAVGTGRNQITVVDPGWGKDDAAVQKVRQQLAAQQSVAQLEKMPAFDRMPIGEQFRLRALLGGQSNALSAKARDEFSKTVNDPAFAKMTPAQQDAALRKVADTHIGYWEARNAAGSRVAAAATVSTPKSIGNYGFAGAHAPAVEYTVSVNGHDVTVVMPANASASKRSIDQVVSALALLPPDVAGKIDRVVANPVRNPHDAFWEQKKGMKGFTSAMTAGTGGTVTIYPAESSDPRAMATTMMHEAGHVASGQRFGPLNLSTWGWGSWQKAMAEDKHAISDYATTAKEEDFAETYRMYVATRNTPQHEEYRRIYPSRFALIDQVIQQPSLVDSVHRWLAGG